MFVARARGALVVAVALLTARGALADPTPGLAESLSGTAKTAFDSGTLLMNNQDSAGALVKFSQAYDLSKEPRLLYDMAICEKNLHHYARMRTLLEQYEREGGATLTPTMQVNIDRALQAVDNLVGALRINVSEPGAVVSIDGQTVAAAPLPRPLVLDLGRHTVSVRKDGFVPLDKPVDIAGGNAVSIDLTLVRSTTAYLTVESDSAASISVDGTLSATGRLAGPIAPGPHDLTVTEPGKRPYTLSLTINPGETRTLEVALEEQRRRSLVPWIVGGSAVVVVGAIVGGYFLFKSSASGTSAPPAGQLGTISFSSLGR